MQKNYESIENFIDERKPVMNGYIRPISPEDTDKYRTVLSNCDIWQGEKPFAVTVFGDIIAYDDEGYVILLRLVDGTSSVICAESELFFSLLNDPDFQKDYFDIESYKYARDNVGVLEQDESYTYEPIPALGGNKSNESLSKGKTYEYMSVLTSFI